MQKLEKILEEMKESSIMVATSKEHYIHPQDGRFVEEVVLLNDVEEIIRKHMSGKGKDAHMNDGWVPVEERLPEEYGEYLVTIVPSAGYLWAKRIIANFSDLMGIVKKPIFYTGEVGKIDFEDITDMVIAWSPIPEPYRPERSSDEKE
nr:hypothetical protein [uncultured Merdimonas sp.]DAZ20004.1 MAG TPA: Protein of unknown function (DUF551) [Caudoviricetes sp.]